MKVKRRKLRRLTAAALTVIIALSGATVTAQAAEATTPGIGYTSGSGENSGAWEWTDATVYKTDTGKEIKDLFGDITKNLVPGDVKNITVKLTNNDAEGDVVFALYARALKGEESRALTASAGDFANKTANDELLNKIQLEISNYDESSTLYSGPMGGDSAPDSIYGSFTDSDGTTVRGGKILGRVSAGKTGILKIAVSVDDIGNEYQNALAAVEWRILAEPYIPEEEEPGPTEPGPSPQSPVNPGTPVYPGTPGGGGQTQTAPPVEIAEDGPPLGGVEPAPETEAPVTIEETAPPLIDIPEEIPDEEVPLADYEIVPKTGDSGNILTWAALCGATAAALTGWLIAAIIRRKGKTRA
jgi:hypothetical protein